ncbi:MAG: phosphoadenylyl-sulfate reductase [Burkholderiaceae bacterium]
MSSLTQPRAALTALLTRIAAEHAPAALASSLSIEDMVITDAIFRAELPIAVFTLDTGRLHGDTLALLDEVERRYGRRIDCFRPDPQRIAAWVARHGENGFYDSVALRHECCAIRKVEPLDRALSGRAAWITGQRREQSVTRTGLAVSEFDAARGIPKFNPLADWSEDEVWAYLREHHVPFNRLYQQGYRSIGCAPCTRPTVAGEDVRAGRWWWEQPESRECGLHLAPDGRLVRSKVIA